MAGPPEPKPVEAAMTGSARRLPWSLVVLIPSTTPGGISMRTRTLYRALAIALTLVAISPLFGAGKHDTPQPEDTQRFGPGLR